MRKIALIALGALLLGTLTVSAFASLQTQVIADTDCSLAGTSMASNYGSSNSVYVENGTKYKNDGWFMFDTSSIKSGYDALYGAGNWTVTGINFIGSSWDASNSAINGNAYFAFNSNNSWTEMGINGNNEPSTSTDTRLTTWNYVKVVGTGLPADVWQTISLGTSCAGLVNSILAGGDVTIHNTAATGTQIVWNSKEFYGNGAYLDVSAQQLTPEPAAFLALATGLVGLLGFARRRS